MPPSLQMLKILMLTSLVTLNSITASGTDDGLTLSFTIRLSELSTLREAVNNSEIRQNLTETILRVTELERELQVVLTGEDVLPNSLCRNNIYVWLVSKYVYNGCLWEIFSCTLEANPDWTLLKNHRQPLETICGPVRSQCFSWKVYLFTTELRVSIVSFFLTDRKLYIYRRQTHVIVRLQGVSFMGVSVKGRSLFMGVSVQLGLCTGRRKKSLPSLFLSLGSMFNILSIS